MLNETPYRGTPVPPTDSLIMSGNFLPYGYYGATDGTPEYGFKED